MAGTLPIYTAQPEHSYDIQIDDRSYQIRLVYRSRLDAWYLDVSEADGTPIALGRRVAAGWGPLVGVVRDEVPTGLLWATYEDGTPVLTYFAAADIPAIAADAAPVVVLS